MFGSIVGSAHLSLSEPFLAPRKRSAVWFPPGHLPAIGALTHGLLDLPGHAAYVAEATRDVHERRKNDQQQPRVCTLW